MKKRMTAMFLSILLLCGASLQVSAADSTDPAMLPDGVLYYGTITDLAQSQDGSLTYVVMDSEKNGELVLLAGPDTCYVDASTKTGTSADALLTVGANLYVYHSPAMTMSIPGQTEAYVFIGNVPADATCPHYHVAGDVTVNDDGSVTVSVDQGSLLLTVSNDATVMPYLTRQYLTVEDIQPGTRFLAWYDVVLTSYPGQGGTDYVLVLPSNSEEEPVAETGVITCGDTTLELSYREENGVKMVPVRAVAEALGLQVSYAEEGADRNVTVESDTFAVHMTAGVDSIYGVTTIPDAVGMTAPQSYGAAPYIETPGTTWAPAEMFTMLGATVTETDGALTITIA